MAGMNDGGGVHMLTAQDRDCLRALAAEVAEIASRPEQAARRALWFALNGQRGERPMVLIDQVCWHEMDVDGSLACSVADPYWRDVECALRREVYRARYMPVDRVVNPYITLPRPVINTGWGLEKVMDTLATEPGNAVVSQHMHNQINDFDDLEKIHFPQISVDTALEAEIIAEAKALFAGIIPFYMTGQTLHLGLWDTISYWMGVENCYIELLDRPELLHALMEKLTQGTLAQIEQMNRLGLFDIHSNLCHCSHTFMDGVPPAGSDPEHPVSKDAWAFGLAQLFTAAAPAVTEEFEAAYMKRIFPQFGAIYYGCCERLDDRLDVIAGLPNVKKISCSPWSDKERFAERMPTGRVMSCKPTPALLATDTMDEEAVRRDLRESIAAAKRHGRQLEFILKDISTVRHDPQRLWRWAEIAMEEVQR